VVDAADSNQLKTAMEKADVVIVASGTIDQVETVARSALDCRIDYLDTQLSTKIKIKKLTHLKPEIERAGCCFITDGGFHPGLPAALVRYVAGYFDQLHRADLGSLIKLDWNQYSFSESTINEMIDEFRLYQPIAFQNGEWKSIGWNNYQKFNFGEPFGEKICAPMLMQEMLSLPATIPSLRETGFYVAGFNWFTDYLVMPMVMVGSKIFPEKSPTMLGKLFVWSLRKFSLPPFRTILKLDAVGIRHGATARLELTVSHDDGYFLTAAAVVSCLKQFLNGKIRQSGLWFQGEIVHPETTIGDLQRMGISVKIE
ncbi:MAG: hypothetical protein SCK70_12490, partial [bacterium]|nr:hypothetical protein [bacterium]